jgi:hypothetical protein
MQKGQQTKLPADQWFLRLVDDAYKKEDRSML